MNEQLWNQLGRTPQEFKEGDIVRRHQDEYFEIREVSKTGKTLIVGHYLEGQKNVKAAQCELICPREQRFN